MKSIPKYFKAVVLTGLLFTAPVVTQANPIACFDTNMGDFCIELFEAHTPITTANFIDYIHNEAYTHGIFHRSVSNFVVQGGGYKVIEGASGDLLVSVSTAIPIKNEFKISNTRGTVAMAKVADNPDSATSQWFVNMNDNNAADLDTQNGGFTVFGRVLFNGMLVFDAIEKLPVYKLSSTLSEIPTINLDTTNLTAQSLIASLVKINQVTVTDTTGVYDQGTASFSVDIGSGTNYEVSLRLVEDTPSFVFELASAQALATSPTNLATYSLQSGVLHIPSVMISANTRVNNVVMQLTNAETYQFVLVSYE